MKPILFFKNVVVVLPLQLVVRIRGTYWNTEADKWPNKCRSDMKNRIQSVKQGKLSCHFIIFIIYFYPAFL